MARNEPGIPYDSPLRYVGPHRNVIPIRKFPRIPLTTDVKYPIGQIVILDKSPSTGSEGDLYYLSHFDSGDAQWQQIAVGAGDPGIDTVLTDDGAPSVPPDGSGVLTVAGGTGITTSGQEGGGNTTVTVTLDTPVSVANGGTGASSLTDGGILLGSGTSAVTVTSQPTNGQLLVGSTGVDPVLATLSEGSGIDIINGAGSISLSAITGGGPGYANLGWSYSAGTFTVHGADGTALSSTNPAYVTLPDKDNANQFVTYEITSNQSFIDDAGSSEILNNLFGTETGVAWANDMPFFIYAVANDAQDTIQFMLSRNPCAYKTPAAANIGAPDDAVADSQRDFWSFDNIDETLYESNPCLPIGGIRMQKSASDDWTVQTLVAGKDGPGCFYEGIAFSFPKAHFGAATNTWFLDRSDATYPLFDTSSYTYFLSKNGWVDINIVLITCGTQGSGTNALVFTFPLQSTTESGEQSMGQTQPIRANFLDNSGGTSNLYSGYLGALSNTTSTGSPFKKEGSSTNLTPDTIDSSDSLNIGHRYKAF